MARYTAEVKLAFTELRDYRGVVVNGSCEIYTWDDFEYVLTDTLTTGSYPLFTRGLSFKFVPTGSVFIEEGISV